MRRFVRAALFGAAFYLLFVRPFERRPRPEPTVVEGNIRLAPWAADADAAERPRAPR